MRKMKDIRGSYVLAVRIAILRKFGLQLISNRCKNSREILDWKQFKEVKDSYNKLFTEDIAIEEITNSAFPSLVNADEEKFNDMRSEEHTSELQSRLHLVCRLLLEKKKQNK